MINAIISREISTPITGNVQDLFHMDVQMLSIMDEVPGFVMGLLFLR
ncbi:hypothetical protein [Lentibacillus juripiscarius]|uniref:Uncharacterized protein n=1 Tax=Lentibacillus juripiscarius TaxID=257446 RepID=A0ABW5V5M1_9BACI